MSHSDDFDRNFAAITGNSPFPWQRALFERLVAGDIPAACSLPTGLGKTSVLAVWLLALAQNRAAVPRRLAYVVNRRTVVDQATADAEEIRRRLVSPSADGVAADVVAVREQLAERLRARACVPNLEPLAISTLRGQFADNGEWRFDPARPAIVVGTVDMIGSRLLFAGYGLGFRTRPLHAGFLGQDTLLVHDEAHLEPAFQRLLTAIMEAQRNRPGDLRPLRVLELTATSRSTEPNRAVFQLTADDRADETVRRRLNAKKRLRLHAVEDEKKTADRLVELALQHADSGQAILVFARTVKDVEQVASLLKKSHRGEVQVLTGTMRGYEREQLVKNDAVFARFLPSPPPGADSASPNVTAYLVCTSAGEVGVNISADHLVCDLTPFDSLAQRLGRVNRFGSGDARIDVVYPTTLDENSLTACRMKTLELLHRLPQSADGYDACPQALSELDPQLRRDAFTPEPEFLTATDVLFDAWSLTTVRGDLPGRPPVADWLHGVADWEPPQTEVAWREEVQWVTGDALREHPPEELLDVYPLKPHELLRDRTARILERLTTLAERTPAAPLWLITPNQEVRVLTLHEAVETDRQNRPRIELGGCTVVLPPLVGGLNSQGLFAEGDPASNLDVADLSSGRDTAPLRMRVWDAEPGDAGMRLVRTIRLPASDEEEESEDVLAAREWRWFVRPRSADDEGSWSAMREQLLEDHLQQAAAIAERLAEALELPGELRSAIVYAARHHDDGKQRPVWQKAIGNAEYPQKILAKSGHGRPPENLSHYRHEFGSLLDVAGSEDLSSADADWRDLVLQLIAAHHGRARPHFPCGEVRNEAFDPQYADEESAAAARETPRRFARLQRKYGRWGLAWLESLVRAADYLASNQDPGGRA